MHRMHVYIFCALVRCSSVAMLIAYLHDLKSFGKMKYKNFVVNN